MLIFQAALHHHWGADDRAQTSGRRRPRFFQVTWATRGTKKLQTNEQEAVESDKGAQLTNKTDRVVEVLEVFEEEDKW
jgi:hypothetical protein